MPSNPHRPVIALIQARMGSTRLPGKALLVAAGRSLFAHLVERLRAATTLDKIAVATTTSERDDAIIIEAEALGIGVFRGSEADVLERFRGAAERFDAATIVRVTADCPLMDPAEVDRVVSAYVARRDALDYAANQGPGQRRGPLGLAVEVFSRAALERAAADARQRHQREHVTPFLYDSASGMRAEVLAFPRDLSHFRLTVDTPEDFAVVRPVLEAVDGLPDAFALRTAVRFLAEHPEIAIKNSAVRQKTHRESETTVALFRADASVAAGAGHVMRMLGVAQAWIEAGGRAVMVSRAAPAALARRLEAVGAQLVDPGCAVSGGVDDARATRELALSTSAGVVVVDGYGFAFDYLRELGVGGPPVVYVDDYGLPDLPVAAVIMPNAGARPPEGRGGGRGTDAVVWAGADFVPVRAEFRNAPRPRRSFEHNPLRLLITFGGSDPANMTLRGVETAIAVAEEFPLEITALLGPAHPDTARVRALAREVEILHDVRDMAGLVRRVDVALCGAGTTCWELATLGVPMLLVPVADNQRVVVDGLLSAGAARTPTLLPALTDAALLSALRAILTASPQALQAMSVAGRRLIDGQGACRIADRLAQLAGGGS